MWKNQKKCGKTLRSRARLTNQQPSKALPAISSLLEIISMRSIVTKMINIPSIYVKASKIRQDFSSIHLRSSKSSKSSSQSATRLIVIKLKLSKKLRVQMKKILSIRLWKLDGKWKEKLFVNLRSLLMLESDSYMYFNSNILQVYRIAIVAFRENYILA